MEEPHDVPTNAPRLAFLGFCERAKEIMEGHPVFWGWNLLGTSTSRVFHVFPMNLNGITLLVAAYRPNAGEHYALVFRGTSGEPTFDLTLAISGFAIAETPDGSNVINTEHHEGRPTDGWAFIPCRIQSDVVVTTPGIYKVLLKTGEHEQPLGTVFFVHAPTPPFSPEDVAALRSDPLAIKFVRMEFSCNKCMSKIRAYAGIEKSDSLEKDGYRWSQTLEDRFECSCKATTFSLEWIKSGLHGLLRRNVAPAESEAFASVRMYEKTALEQSCREFLAIIDKKNKEEVAQKFIENNPVFLHIFQPRKILFKPPILTKYFADFAILNSRNELVLVEIERPHLKLLKKDGGSTADLEHAFHQIRTWMQTLNDHRAAALEALDLKLSDVAKVKGVIVAGRNPTIEAHIRLLRVLSSAEIELFTYDDLLGSVTELVKQIATV